MTQDFAKKKRSQSSSKSSPKKKTINRKRPTTKQKAPAWAWLIIGLLLAALITLLIYLANKPAASETSQIGANTEITKQKKQKPPQPRFDFYTILKDRKVEVVDRSAEIQASSPSNIHYFLQASSFRNKDDAESLRAKLLLINLPVNIEQKTNDSGSIWHRVIVGPFTSRSKMAKAQSTLASQNLRPLVIKRTIDE